jgi:phosphate transport system protein
MTAVHDTSEGFRHFHDQIGELKARLLEMSTRAEEMIDHAVGALLHSDEGLAETVVSSDSAINALEVEIEQRAIALLALQQPLARDLRFIVGAIGVSRDLERVGDHAVNIAHSSLRLTRQSPALLPDPEVEDMARRARAMLGDSIDAFLRGDGALGRAVCGADDAVDALHDSIFRILLTHMMQDARTITPALELLLVSRNLERVADLATNIGESAVYLAEGKQIKHHFED